MTHRQAVGLMVLVTLLWSIAGVVTRHLDSARSFEVTFWRSFFTALSLAVGLLAWRGRGLWTSLRDGGRWLWLFGLCWAVMFTAFMLALTLTSVAYVLVTMALGPVITALFSRIFLRFPLPWSTWLAIVVAGLGVAVMFGGESGDGFAPAGVLVACCVPLAGAANWTVLQRVRQQRDVDMLPAVLVGAVLSSFAKFGKHLESYYDLLAAVDKLGHLAELPVESLEGERLPRIEAPAQVTLRGVRVAFAADQAPALSGVDLQVQPGEEFVDAVDGAVRRVFAQQRARALAEAARLTQLRVNGGVANQLEAIEAERAALAAQSQLADAQRALAVAQAGVFRALGGGWAPGTLQK